MPNAEMKTLTIGDTTYEIVDEEAREKEGDLSELNTQVQTDLVAAINEVADNSGVASVNGKTGVVVLAASDVGAATTGALTDETTARTEADAQLQGQITALGNGAPIPVETIAAMTVQTQVYLYTGSETGESTGYWYSYDSSQAKFVPRGEYGAGVIIDDTFTIPNAAAGSVATGQALNNMDDRVETIEENLTAEDPVPLVYYSHKFISSAGNVSTYASYNCYNFDLAGIEKVSVTSRNNGKIKTRLIAFYSSDEGISENLLLAGELYEAYDETYHTEIFEVPDGAVSVYVVSDNTSVPVVKKVYTIDLESELDDLNDSVETIPKIAEKLDNLFTDVKGEQVDFVLANGSVANHNNTDAVRSENAIPCAYGDVITIEYVRPLTTADGWYAYTYTIYDGGGNTLKEQTTAIRGNVLTISYADAASVKFAIFEKDGEGNNLVLRKDTYGYTPYAIVSDGSDLTAKVDKLYNSANDEYENLLSQARYSDTSGATHLTLLHFSDAHDNLTCMTGAVKLADTFPAKIDDMIHTGDTVLTNFSQGIAKWIASGCAEKAMNCIGNHDYYANSNLSMNDHASKTDLYNTFFAPYVSGWGVTQPTGVDDSTSGDYLACYYYKDYSAQGIRLIVLDSEQWDTAELAWFTATLESARTAGYAVVVASHCAAGAVTGLEDSNFNYLGNPDFVSSTPTFATITDDAFDAIDTFIAGGGHFVVWLAGHFHRGGFGYAANHPDILVMVAEKAGTARTSGSARINGEINANSYNVLTIDPTDHLIRLVRFGADVDGWLRGRHAFCYDYLNKQIVSQW